MFLAGMTNGRSLPAVAQVPFRDIFPTIEQKVENPKGKIALYAGCLLDFVYPDIARDVILDLNSIGYTVDFPMDQGCCGSPAVTLADDVNAVGAAQNNLEAMHAEDYDYIVSACPSCTEELHKYTELFEEGTEEYKKAKELGEKTFDFCKLFTMLGGVADAGDDKPMKVTYHTSCHLNRANGVYDEPREILKHTNGVELVEMFETDQCCGFGGAYCIQYPEVSQKILEKKIKYIEETGADTVAVDCPGCLMQIKGGLDAAGSEIKTKHTASIIAEKRGLI
jgi:Fe-S oxidoreductase